MHQFHKYAHGLHISISRRLSRTKFGIILQMFLIIHNFYSCENRFKLQGIEFSFPRKIYFTI